MKPYLLLNGSYWTDKLPILFQDHRGVLVQEVGCRGKPIGSTTFLPYEQVNMIGGEIVAGSQEFSTRRKELTLNAI